jgi:hypothetical protein
MNTPPHHVNPEVQLPPSQGQMNVGTNLRQPSPATHTGAVEAEWRVVKPAGLDLTAASLPNGQLAAALAKAQGEMKAAVYNKINPHFKNRYADLAAVLDAVRGPLSKHGIGYTQIMETQPDFALVTTLHHTSGQVISSRYPLPLGAKPQELGSALTYARRYSLSAICGVAADEDDDAEAANKIEDKPLTPEQVEHLQILIVDTATDIPKFLGYMAKLTKLDIKRLEDIPQSQFPTAFAALSKKAKVVHE